MENNTESVWKRWENLPNLSGRRQEKFSTPNGKSRKFNESVRRGWEISPNLSGKGEKKFSNLSRKGRNFLKSAKKEVGKFTKSVWKRLVKFSTLAEEMKEELPIPYGKGRKCFQTNHEKCGETFQI